MFNHTTVLLNEAVNGLDIKPDGIYVDCTLGGAGHSALILSKLSENGKLYAFDQDEIAINHAKEKLASHGDKLTIIKSNFITFKRRTRKTGMYIKWMACYMT